MSADGIRISFVSSKGRELGKYMSETLDTDWKQMRGMEIQSVGIGSISYTQESQDLINLRNQGAMMSDPTIREGYIQKNIADGIKNAGSNPNGAMNGFIGMGLGMQGTGQFMGSFSETNRKQMETKQAEIETHKDEWVCSCGHKNSGNFCSNCGEKKPQNNAWTCECGTSNTGNFCSNCGKKKPEDSSWTCECGTVNTGRFCSNCGKKRS